MGAQTKTVQPTIVNGINVDDLLALIERVRREPAKGMTSWRVTTSWQGQARSRAEIESYGIGGEKVPRRFSIDIDEPRGSRSTSTNRANSEDRTVSPIRRSI